MSFPRYPKYKDSGVEWLGKVPEDWKIDRLKRSIISCKNGIWGEEANQDINDIPCVRVADFDRQRLCAKLSEPTIRNVTEKERVGRVLSQGDLLLEKSGGGENQPVGCVVLYEDTKPAVCSNFVARILIAQDMNSSFWRYVHAAAYAVRLNTRSIKQTSGIQNLDDQQYFDERAGFPPYPEQTRIATFLDHETAKIDELVAEQRRLMELLKEKRQAVISHAVTKGLNPEAHMKPSGIEWLGDVPEQWKITPLKNLVTFNDDVLDEATAPDTEIVYVDISSVDGINGIQSKLKMLFCDAPSRARRRVKNDDVIISTVRTYLRAVARICNAEENLIVSTGFAVIRPRDAMIPHFLGHMVYASYFIEQVIARSTGVSYPAINASELVTIPVALPTIDEQVAIVAYIEAELTKFDTLTNEAQYAINLLQERRTALISAAVTGQIDVRRYVNEEVK